MSFNESHNTRSRLLQSAAQLMWERSFQAVGVDELCQRANAKKGSFYHFFSSKTDLGIAAIESLWEITKEEIFEPAFSNNKSGLVQLSEFIERAYQFQTQIFADKNSVWGCPFGNLGQEMAQQDESMRAALQRIFEANCYYIEKALIRAEQAGEIPPGDNHQRAKNIFALLEGGHLLAKVGNDPQIFRQVMVIAAKLAAS